MKRQLTEIEKIEKQISKLNSKKWDLEKELETKRYIILLSDEEYDEYQKIMKLKSLLKDSEII